MNISLATRSDAADIAEIHYDEIDQGFLRTLGKGVLTGLYEAVIENPESFTVIARENGEIAGFIAGSTDIGKLYKDFFQKHSWRVVISGFFTLINPKKWKNIAQILRYPKIEQMRDLPQAELISIAVKKELQGKGIAKAMFEMFVSEMKKRNVKAFKAMAGEKLTSAIALYEKLGFRYVSQISIHPETASRIYIYTI